MDLKIPVLAWLVLAGCGDDRDPVSTFEDELPGFVVQGPVIIRSED